MAYVGYVLNQLRKVGKVGMVVNAQKVGYDL
jgi:hypothetical protein